MIFMPPRHGKSELASIRFPAWYIGKYPDRQIITSSYAQELASYFGRQVRNLINSPEFKDVFRVVLAPDSAAAHRWHTHQGGAYLAAGVGGPITGRGADLLVIDDPIKSREDADSEVNRDRVWEWYRSTAFTRLMPNGAIVIIQTRWHDDDLAGRLLSHSKDWDILELPAIDDEGKALWPEWYSLEALGQIKNTVGPREWSALYQQQPTPEEGDYFKREWVQYYDKAPDKDTLAIYGASDYAVTDSGGDWTVHGIIGVDPKDNIYVLDWWRQRTTSDEWVEVVIDLMDKWKPRKWAEEGGQILKSIGPFLEKRMRERRVYCLREQYSSSSDKPTRAQSFRARMAMGMVYFPENSTIPEELLRFPQGVHDDQVDVLSLLGRMLSEMGRGRMPKKIEPPRGRTMNDIDRAEKLRGWGRQLNVAYYAR